MNEYTVRYVHRVDHANIIFHVYTDNVFSSKWQLNLLILSHFELTLTFETVKEYSFLQKNEENPEEVKTMKYLSVRNLVRFASCVHNDYQTWVRTFPGLVHSYTNCCLKTEFWQFGGRLDLFDHSLKWTCSTCCICSEYFFGRRISSWMLDLYDGVVLCFFTILFYIITNILLIYL